ncbi:acyl-CoA thioesterase [Tomitella gaofuii]|uniref:acyl-CoA thioesterase n=1 Tax=Tomitella gaofuii TaxID=2760083 RepID=UPI0015F85998|nr:acyl-CoA thioesterase [Tomitella gaofuii]
MTGRHGAAGAPSCALTVRVPMRYEDITPAMHVSNAAVLSLIEEARNRLLRYGAEDAAGTPVGGLLDVDGADRVYLIVQQTIEYPEEVRYSVEPLRFDFWIGHVGRSSFTLDAEVRAAGAEQVLVRTESVVVITDAAFTGSEPIDDALRRRLEAHRAEPVPLRPRPGASAMSPAAR